MDKEVCLLLWYHSTTDLCCSNITEYEKRLLRLNPDDKEFCFELQKHLKGKLALF